MCATHKWFAHWNQKSSAMVALTKSLMIFTSSQTCGGLNVLDADLTNLGRKYSDQWHVLHLIDPRQVVPTSIMPAYPWLFEQTLSGNAIGNKMETLRTLGVPYTDQEISDARLQIRGKTKGEALIRYLQSLGQDTAQEVAP